MSASDFLAAVLPPEGNGLYCFAAYTEERKQHRFVQRIADAAEYVDVGVKNGRDMYFALATYEERGSRTAANARFIRSIAIDMDGYESRKDAGLALSAFLVKTGLEEQGLPWIVNSGGGLHCYWTFANAVPIAQWKPAAENLKRLAKQEGLQIDMTVTADAARVLRIPGTVNFKKKYATPRKVSLLAEGTVLKFELFAEALLNKLEGSPFAAAPIVGGLEIAGQRPSNAPGVSGLQLMANSDAVFKRLLVRTQSGDGCAQLDYYTTHATNDGLEPLWRAWLSQAKYCTDGTNATVKLSRLHPYPAERMEQKLREIKGPYPCVKFDSENPGICGGCKHWGRITNPLALAREAVPDTDAKEVTLPQPADVENAPVVKVLRPEPPRGFFYGTHGGVYIERIEEDDEGKKQKRQVMILPYALFAVDLLKQEHDHLVHMVAMRPDPTTDEMRVVDVLIPQRTAVSKDEMLKALAQQNVIAAFGAGNDKNLFEYVRACIEKVGLEKRATRVPTQYGWQPDGGFVFAGKTYTAGLHPRAIPMPDLANITRATQPRGSLEAWRQFPEMLVRRGHYDMLALLCVGFGSPLMPFTQMSALTFHAGSTESGTGKSLTLNAVASIWGHPVHYRVGKSTSPVTMQQRCGNLNNLPFVSDEITHKSRLDMEWFPGLVFDLSEGRGKEKSEVHNNRERMNNVSWSLLAFLTSNTHMHDYMSGVRAHSSQGELFRMLEWTPTETLNWTDDETQIIRSLQDNYGVAGERYAQWLVANRATAEDLVKRVMLRLRNEWNMSGDERFWNAGCAAVVAGAVLAGSKFAGVVDLPINGIIASLKGLVERARKVVRNNKRSCVDILNMFTREHYGHFIVLRKSNGQLLAALGNGELVDQSLTRNRIMGRVEHGVKNVGRVEYFIEEQLMKAHCVAHSFGYDDFKRALQRTPGYRVDFGKKNMTAGTRGPSMTVSVIRIERDAGDDDRFPATDNNGGKQLSGASDGKET